MKSYPGLNVVMYHYILKNNKFNNLSLNSLDTDKFVDQLNSISKQNKIISPEEFRFKLKKKYKFKNEFILTFDDGYKCNYEIVKKILDFKNIKGFFYPTCYPYKNNKLLDINIIHLILSKEKNTEILFNFIMDHLKTNQRKMFLKIVSIIKKIKKCKSYDDEKTKVIKKLLQSYLPEKIKSQILKLMIYKVFKKTQIPSVNKFYLSINQIKKLNKEGHEIGLHGFKHNRYEFMNLLEQDEDINKSKIFWNKILKKKTNWSLCYPYGSHNDLTKKLLKKHKIQFAFTTKKGSNLNPYNNALILKRWDANDLLK